MPTYSAVGPDGHTYTITGPAGATDSQVMEELHKQYTALHSGNGGNASAEAPPAEADQQNPPPAPLARPKLGHLTPPGQVPESPPVGANPHPARAIGQATVEGGLMGAIAPYAVQGAGLLAAATPGAEEFAPGLLALGQGMKAARMSEVAYGALSGLSSEVAGQAAEGAGAGAATAAGARLAGGFAGPSAMAAITPYVGKGMHAAVGLVHALASGETEAAATTTARAAIASKAILQQPQHTVYAALQRGADEGIAAAGKAAAAIRSRGTQAADAVRKVIPEQVASITRAAEEKAAQLERAASIRYTAIAKATNGKAALASRVLAKSDEELSHIGSPVEYSDTGTMIRDAALAREDKLTSSRRAKYQELMSQRDIVVQQKEAQGKFVDSTPAMRELKSDLNRKLLRTTEGLQAAKGKAEATEQGVVAAYKRVSDAINNRVVTLGVDAYGRPVQKEFKTTFEALDHVRRRLNDVGYGSDSEGYAALGQDLAKKLANKIREVQVQYAGPVQDRLLSTYATDTKGVAGYKTTSGSALTKVDPKDMETFLKSPGSLPGRFFKSSHDVRQLIDLTGDKALVEKAARQYVSRSLQGQSAKQTQAWLAKPEQTDWMREFPALQAQAKSYAGKLEQIERIHSGLGGQIGKLQGERAAIPSKVEGEKAKLLSGAQRQAEGFVKGREAAARRIESEGAKAASKSFQSLSKEAAGILKSENPTEAVEKLLTKGSVSEKRRAIQAIAGTPGGGEALRDSVRGIMAKAPAGQIEVTWNEKILPRLKEGNLIPRKELDRLDSDVQNLIRTLGPKAAKPRIHRRVVEALAVAGNVGIQALPAGDGG